MMDNEIDRELLEKIADMLGKPVGAFNIRKDCGCDGRQSTEHIQILDRDDGKAGINIRIADGTVNETCHIPVIITKSGVEETVYNDFFIGENCDVEIVAGCGIHNCGEQTSRHDGVHVFHVGKHSRVHYSEKHYGEGDGKGGRIMNPQTIVYLDEGASIQMDTTQIRGVDSTKRYTKIVCGKDAEAVITERPSGRKRYGNRSGWRRCPGPGDFPLGGAGLLQPGLLSPYGGQRRLLWPCAVRLHHYGRRQDQIHPCHYCQLHRGTAHP